MIRLASAVLVLGLLASSAQAAPDGAKLFILQCQTCHLQASSEDAPSLAGVVGAPIAARGDFLYSDALKAKAGESWTAGNLDAYLKSPQAFAPGNMMNLTAVLDSSSRAAVIAYLKTLK